MTDPRVNLPPSPWIARFAHLVPAGGGVLDVAAGSGRHTRLFLDLGHPVTAVDRRTDDLAALKTRPNLEIMTADLENTNLWPFDGRHFVGVIVANYLHRPLFPALVAALAPGGVLLYETFAAGNERFGRPSNPDFLLRPGELLEIARGRLRVVAYEDLETVSPKPAMVQRIAAVAP